METITRNVSDLKHNERRTYETLLGHSLRENQQIVIQVVTPSESAEEKVSSASTGQLPDWCHVYDGLTDDEIVELEDVILRRADLARPS
jgi:hypothetical protein